MYIFRIMESVETTRLKYFISILGTKNNVSNNLIRLVLCFPKMEYLLFNRLLNVIEKYKLHFEENITIYDEIVNDLMKELMQIYYYLKDLDIWILNIV